MGNRLGIRLLGPFEVETGGVPIKAPVGKQRALLAVLALQPERMTSTDELIDRLWADAAPNGARTTVRGYVMRLRRMLDQGWSGSVIVSDQHGYRLDAASAEVDAQCFEKLASRASATTDAAQEAELLGRAVSMWRGPVLCDVRCEPLQREVRPALEEQWRNVQYRRIELALARGDDAGVVPELRELVTEHPLEERFWVQLLAALHAGGRQAEALTAYAECRSVLAEHLGVEPGSCVREVYERVLADDRPAQADLRVRSDGARRPGESVPRQLPRQPVGFVGREAELAALDEAVFGAPSAQQVIVSGPAGVGKTATAIRWAHQRSSQFPDGQLYVDLNGFGPGDPVTPVDALTMLITGTGGTARDVPQDPGMLSALLRSTLAGKRMLLVLDNARCPEQVRPLLPGNDVTVLLTSRSGLRGLVARDGAERIRLGRLPAEEAAVLVRDVLGEQRCRADRAAIAELVEVSDRLPLALRIVAERAARYPQWPLDRVVAEVRNAPRAIAAFDTGEPRTNLHSVLFWSYQTLAPGPARLFRVLGSDARRTYTASDFAELAGGSEHDARSQVEALLDVNLIEHTGPDRFELTEVCHSLATEVRSAVSLPRVSAHAPPGRTPVRIAVPNGHPRGARPQYER